MKHILGWGSALALFAGLTSSAIAGPGPQFWAQQTAAAKARAEAAKQTTAATPDANAMMCSGCKTSDIRTSKQVGPPNRSNVAWTTVGQKHTCTHCTGEITVVKGVVANSMAKDCPMCGTGAAKCVAAVSPAQKT